MEIVNNDFLQMCFLSFREKKTNSQMKGLYSRLSVKFHVHIAQLWSHS